MLVMLLYMLTEVVANHCPYHCECLWRNGKDAALCARAGFKELPNGLLASTQLLDLSENPLRKLKDRVFNDTGLLNLQRLYLTSCDIQEVQPQTFWGLINLVELDLSKNKLTRVPSLSLFYIPGLRELKLSDNPITRIKNEDFQYLRDLVKLSLKSCRILEIEPRSFFGLESSLQYLDLSHNFLRIINVSVVAPLRALRDVALSGNPWNCTCNLRPMRDWMIKRNVPLTITPECAYPSRLRTRQWNGIDINEFVCYPKLETVKNYVYGIEGEDITITCKVSANPIPRIRWYNSGRLLANTSINSASGRYYIIYSKDFTSNLTIKSAELQDAGHYTCVSENQAGAAQSVITVVIEEPYSLFGKHKLFAWFSIVAVIAVALCFILVYLLEFKKEISVGNNPEVAVSYHDEQARIQNNEKRDVEAMGTPEVGRKRGDYQNVPSHDPEDVAYNDRQNLEYESLKHENENKFRNIRDNRLEPDLHIPRKIILDPSVYENSSFVADTLKSTMRMASDNLDNSNGSGTRPRNNNFTYSHISMTDSEKNYPDLIEMSSIDRPIPRNELKHEQHYFTMRRRKESDSYSPLLDNVSTRRSSSGGDSVSCYDTCNKYRQSQYWQRRSNSSSDLTIASNHSLLHQSLPVTPTRHRRAPSATPLLDINSLLQYSRSNHSTSDELENQVYQMESLLNEYRTIGNQMTSSPQMTKDNLQRSRPVVSKKINNRRSRYSVPGPVQSSSTALPDAATPLTLNVSDLDSQPAPERRLYL